MTHNLLEVLEGQVFTNSATVERLMVTFAGYYFQALDHYADHGSLPPVWDRVTARLQPAPVALLLGANAHINHDLPLALRDSVTMPSTFRNDYLAINRILVTSVEQLLAVYQLPTALMRPATSWVLTRMLVHWRRRAWRNSWHLPLVGQVQQGLSNRV